MNFDALKQQAGEYAADFIEPGMVIGLGTGSTAIFATRRIAQRLSSGALRDIVAVPTSLATEAAAIELGIPLTSLAAHPRVDITIDGADEVDPDFNVIKGGGGAHLREKIVAQATERLVIVVDESKLSPQLGVNWPVPVEVIPFNWESQAAYLRSLGGAPALRLEGGGAFQTDQGNIILDCDFGPIADPAGLDVSAEQPRRHRRARAVYRHGRDVVVAGAGGAFGICGSPRHCPADLKSPV